MLRSPRSATSRFVSEFTRSRRSRSRRRPLLECLEERSLLSVVDITVTTLADDPIVPFQDITSLRDAINHADSGSASNQYIINFSVSGSIAMLDALPNLNNNISIEGPGASSLTVERLGSSVFPVFTVGNGDTVNISGITIADGDATNGGGIDNSGTLTVSNTTLAGNTATNDGGGIYSTGILTTSNDVFSNDTAQAGSDIYSNQTIDFGPLANQIYGVAPVALNATATSGLPVSYSVVSGPATVSGDILTVTGGRDPKMPLCCSTLRVFLR